MPESTPPLADAARQPPRSRAASPRLRTGLVAVHRYLGLTIAVVLIVECVTGSIAVFKNELDAMLNPSLCYANPPGPDAKPLDPLVLREMMDRQLPAGLTVWELPLTPPTPGYSVDVNLNWDGTELDHSVDTAYADPYSGKLIGTRNHAIGESWRNLIPFIFQIHYSLALGDVGNWLLGMTATLWTIDCFVALYLTFPPSLSSSPARTTRRSWWSRWKPSWLVRASSLFATIFTFHRASGLWVWPLLLMFAWSSVAMRMMPVYESVTRLFLRSYEYSEKPPLAEPRHHPKLRWEDALAKGKAHMQEQAAKRGFKIEYPYILSHEPSFGFFRYQVKSSLDPSDRWCNTVVWMDSDTGEFSDFWAPTGLNSGSTLTTWLEYLHFGWVGGLSYRILIFIVGVLATVTCVTGVVIWWRKLGGRTHQWRLGDGQRAQLALAFVDLLICGALFYAVSLIL